MKSCTYTGNEPSPKGFGFCARNEQVGTKKIGTDGNVWIVKKRESGRYWAKTSSQESKKTVQKNATSRSSKDKVLLFAEPATFKLQYMNWHKGGLFSVTNNFYNVLLRPPVSKKWEISNAYIFGNKFPTNEYVKIASHDNDVAQTGIIDIELWKNGDYERNSDKIDKVNEKYRFSYSSPKNVEIVRKISGGSVLFQGETVGGDVGADLYAHYDKNGNIDSLIINNDYYFKQK